MKQVAGSEFFGVRELGHGAIIKWTSIAIICRTDSAIITRPGRVDGRCALYRSGLPGGDGGMSKHPSKCLCQRQQFVREAIALGGKLGTLHRAFGISRSTAYAWWARFSKDGAAGLEDRQRGPKPGAIRWERWREPLLKLRRRWPRFGPRKLSHLLRQQYPRQRLPSLRTLSRMLGAAGCIGGRKQGPAGPLLERPKLTRATRSNAVWTIDFKGYFHTRDGGRCTPLTVRDLFSSYILAVEHLGASNEASVRQVLRRCFRRYGLPRVIRVDNGKPFGGEGAQGLTSLSVWWTRLGIRVEFIRPAKPQDNGAHEQMHGVLKQETAQPPAADLRAQQRRFGRFRREYNHQRPHEKLQMRWPAEVYRPRPGPIPKPVALSYPKGWQRKRVSKAGLIYWAGTMRWIGRPFKNQTVGLKPLRTVPGHEQRAVEVYLGRLLLGELHADDPPRLRPVRYHAARKRKRRRHPQGASAAFAPRLQRPSPTAQGAYGAPQKPRKANSRKKSVR